MIILKSNYYIYGSFGGKYLTEINSGISVRCGSNNILYDSNNISYDSNNISYDSKNVVCYAKTEYIFSETTWYYPTEKLHENDYNFIKSNGTCINKMVGYSNYEPLFDERVDYIKYWQRRHRLFWKILMKIRIIS